MTGMRALGSRWGEEWACTSQAPPQRQQQSRQPPQQQKRQQQQQQQSNWAQRAAAAAALPQSDYRRVGKGGKPDWEPTGLEPIKRSIPRDEREIVFERAVGAQQINTTVVTSVEAFVNIALSKVALAHIRTEAIRVSVQ